MKRRLGFVSNSSSSSFVCDITGEAEGGYDVSLRDVGMAECVNDHTFSTYAYPEVDDLIENARDGEDEDEDYDRLEYGYGIPAELCPVCNGKAKSKIVDRLIAEMKRLKINIKDLTEAAK